MENVWIDPLRYQLAKLLQQRNGGAMERINVENRDRLEDGVQRWLRLGWSARVRLAVLSFMDEVPGKQDIACAGPHRLLRGAEGEFGEQQAVLQERSAAAAKCDIGSVGLM